MKSKPISMVYMTGPTLARRQLLARQHREAYEAGRIDAYLHALMLSSRAEDIRENMPFTPEEACRLTILAVEALWTAKEKAEAKIKEQQKLLNLKCQKTFPF